MWTTLLIASAMADPWSAATPDDLSVPDSAPAPDAVVGGSPAEAGAWPQVAALAYGSGDGFVACTGVLIHAEWVLTAGHCAPDPTWIFLDSVDTEAPVAIHEVDETYIYPDATFSFDVALNHLTTPSDLEPVPLALDCVASEWIRADQTVTLTGYGKLDELAVEATSLLHQVDLRITDPTCADVDRNCNEDAMPAGELIAGGGGLDSCTGDSGAPLFLEAAGRHWVAGIASRAATPLDTPCGDGGVYVRPDAVVDWIELAANISLPRPDCEGLNLPPSISVEPLVLQMHEGVRFVPTLADPNLDQTLTLEIAQPPSHGHAAVSDGVVSYQPDALYAGVDQLELRVIDDGSPPESTSATVEIRVLQTRAEPAGCGCTVSGPRSAWWLPMGLVSRR